MSAKQSRLNKTLKDKWVLIFSLPEPLKKLRYLSKNGNVVDGIVKDSVQFTLNSVTMPTLTVKAVPQSYASDNLHVSSHAKQPFELLTIKFDIDNRYANYHTIYQWLNLLHNEREGFPDAYDLIDENFSFKDFCTTLGIVVLDEFNQPLYQMMFTKAFPTSLSGIDYNYKSTDLIEITASFAFSQYHFEPLENVNNISHVDSLKIS